MDLLVAISLILLLVIVAVGWMIVRGTRSNEPFSIQVKDFSMATAWDRQEKHYVDKLAKDTRAAVRDDLLAFEEKLAADSPSAALTVLRRELMDSVDRRILNEEILALPPDRRNLLRSASSEIIQTDNQARRYILANELRLAALREFAGGRFGDKAGKDWFAVYEKAAGMRRRSLAHFLVRSATGDLQQAEDARQQAISMVDTQLRSRLLQVAPGTSFKQLDDTMQAGVEDEGEDQPGTSDRQDASGSQAARKDRET